MPSFGLAFLTAIVNAVLIEISLATFGNDLGIVVASGVEELLKIGLFFLFRQRAFYAILFFALIEIILVKFPVFCFVNLDCFLHGVVFSILGFVFHLSTALLYDRVFSTKLNLVFFSAPLCAAIIIHIIYNTADRIIHSWPALAVFCLACSLIIFGINVMYRKLYSRPIE